MNRKLSFPWFFAKRYFFAKKSANVIHWITGISFIGIAVISAVLIVILSVFNGFESLVISLNDTFYPDLIIQPKDGKHILLDSVSWENEVKKIDGIVGTSFVLEEMALLSANNKRTITTLKGVAENYNIINPMDSAIWEGEFLDFSQKGIVLGLGAERRLELDITSPFTLVDVYLPNRKSKVGSLNLDDTFTFERFKPQGVFSIQADFDTKYCFVPITHLQRMLDYRSSISAIEIGVIDPDDVTTVQNKIAQLIGDNYTVKNRKEQDEFLYKIMNMEKWISYMVLLFVLLIASFTLIGALALLVIEKSKDISILKAMGATANDIRAIFLMEGMMIGIIGGLIGIVLAFIICLLQEQFGIIRLEGNYFLLDAYPVKMKLFDFIMVAVAVVLISCITAWYPAKKASEIDHLVRDKQVF